VKDTWYADQRDLMKWGTLAHHAERHSLTAIVQVAYILILALFALPLAVEAQQARVYRVGVVLHGGPYYLAIDGLRDGLRELGLEEGKQFVLHVRDGKGDLKSVAAAARSLEGEKVDLIYAVNTSVTLAARASRSCSMPGPIRCPSVSSRASGNPEVVSRASTARARVSRRSASSC